LIGLVAGILGDRIVPEHWPTMLTAVLTIGGLGLVVVGLALTFVPGAPRIAARSVGSPVAGRWLAVNSPASRVPSHGTHAHGQTFAIDLAYEPAEGSRPEFGKGPAFRPPEDFPAFGQPVRAPADGRVVAVRNTARDHRSRSTWLAFGYLMLEGMVRELVGSRLLLGNVIVLDIGQGAYAALAHLRRGSVSVRPGDLISRGDPVARCGNSGNSTEPHLHFQLMDHPSAYLAAGLPFTFSDVPDGLPGNGQAMTADQPPGS
jgi:murein DD-endopeptidase MepM/ murein hydrolase activator NlpD